MRRPLLLTLIAVGSLVVLIGGTGLFAALTDTASTGTNTVDSAALAGSADIQIATATRAADISCGTFSENLTTGFYTVSDARAGDNFGATYFCLKNVGSQAVNIWAQAIGLTDTDTTCTGDEAELGDTTCGGGAQGELSPNLVVQYSRWDACGTSTASGFSVNLNSHSTTPSGLPGPLAVGSTGCFSLELAYPLGVGTLAIQKAQTDRTTWQFRFTAQVP